jgi:hypothetical protein
MELELPKDLNADATPGRIGFSAAEADVGERLAMFVRSVGRYPVPKSPASAGRVSANLSL